MSTVNTRTTTSRQGRISIPGVGREIEDVLLWRDPRISGGVFAAGSFLYFLLEWSGLSLLYIISNTLLALLGLAFLWNTVARFTGRNNASTSVGVQRPVNESDVRELAQKLTQFFNKGLAFFNRLISGQDVVLTAEVAVALYITSKVGKYFSSLGLIYTVFVLGFVIPKIYELRKDDIDSAVSSGYTQSQKGYQQYLKPYVEKIPRASTSARSSGATSNTTGPTAAGRNQGLTSDTATSDGYGSTGQGATLGQQAQNTAQSFKESAQDFVDPNSNRGGQGTMGERIQQAGQNLTGQGQGQGQHQSSGFVSQGQGTGGGNYENNQTSYQQRTPGGQGYESSERQNFGSTAPGSYNDDRQNTGTGQGGSYTGQAQGQAQNLGNRAADMGRQAYNSAADTVGSTGGRY